MKIGEQWMALFQGEENEFRLLCDLCFALPRRLESHDVERSIWFRFDSKAETSPGAKARASWFLSYLIKTHVNETIRAQCNWSFVRVDCFVADLTPELTVDRRWAWARCRSVACRFQRKVSFHSARVKTCKLYSAFRFCFSLWTTVWALKPKALLVLSHRCSLDFESISYNIDSNPLTRSLSAKCAFTINLSSILLIRERSRE